MFLIVDNSPSRKFAPFVRRCQAVTYDMAIFRQLRPDIPVSELPTNQALSQLGILDRFSGEMESAFAKEPRTHLFI